MAVLQLVMSQLQRVGSGSPEFRHLSVFTANYSPMTLPIGEYDHPLTQL